MKADNVWSGGGASRPSQPCERALTCLLYYYQWGRELGGRPPQARRCTKRLGTRLCWNWRVNGTTRCHRHPQEGDT